MRQEDRDNATLDAMRRLGVSPVVCSIMFTAMGRDRAILDAIGREVRAAAELAAVAHIAFVVWLTGGEPAECEGATGPCSSRWGVMPESSRRMDDTDPLYLCRDCAADHHEFWDAQWSDYYSGLL